MTTRTERFLLDNRETANRMRRRMFGGLKARPLSPPGRWPSDDLVGEMFGRDDHWTQPCGLGYTNGWAFGPWSMNAEFSRMLSLALRQSLRNQVNG